MMKHAKSFIRNSQRILAGCAFLFLTNTLSAQNNIGGLKDVNGVDDRTLDSLNIAQSSRPEAGSSRKGNNPVLFLVGNSTMRTGTKGNGDNGQWGWGYFAHEWFDEDRITVENHALGGTSSRTFYQDLWPAVLKGVKKGDWVIIELGHNDNGPYDSFTARASIPGIKADTSLVVTLHDCRNAAWNGRVDTVYTYGEYMRKFIRDVQAKGAHPVLASLTPRNAWDNETTVTRKWDTFTPWGKAVAEEMNVPWIDLEGESARRLEQFGAWKMNYMFYIDKIHTSAFGAKNNAYSAALAIQNCEGLELKKYLKPLDLPQAKVNRQPGKKVVFITGDSTVKIGVVNENTKWGWGDVANDVFDTDRYTLVNCAKAGRSTRTFLNEGRWDEVYNSIQPGDIVTIQFGHNDIGGIDKDKERGVIACGTDSSHVYRLASNRKYEVVYSFGWYLKKFIMDVREKGGEPVLISLSPRNEWGGSKPGNNWENGKIERRNDSYGKWYREVCEWYRMEVDPRGLKFIDLHNLAADRFDAMGEKEAAKYYKDDHTHLSRLGATLMAEIIRDELDKPLGVYSFDMTQPQPVYSATKGFGYDVMPAPAKGKQQPYFFSVDVPDGNYRVTMVLGDKKKAAETTVRAECRRLFFENIKTRKGELRTVEFVVNKRNAKVNAKTVVGLKPGETDIFTWDDKLTIEVTGAAPSVQSIKIERDDAVPTLFLCGNSTVVDQDREPWASWGQMISRWFDQNLAIANYAHSGLAVSSFIAQRRFAKLLTQVKAGDYVIVEFGHNDQKERGPGKGAYYNFATGLKQMIDEVRAKGATIMFCTPTQRRAWEDDNKTIKETHGDYPAAMVEVAARENVPVIDLHQMTREFFQSLGFEDSKKALVHYPANTFPDQPKALADNTHFNPYGAYEVAKMVVMGLKNVPTFKAISALRSDWADYDPNHPDDPAKFIWSPCVLTSTVKPDGN